MSVDLLSKCSPEELEVRTNFKRDYKLSCPVLDDDDIFNKSLIVGGLEEDWDEYFEMCKRYPDINEYRKKIRNSVINYISSVKEFEELKPEEYKYKFTGPRSIIGDHTEKYLGERLISVDLIKGNYQSLKSISPKFILDTENYEELINRFTKEKCLISSKFFRQMVFGLLKPDVQAARQKNLLGDVIERVFKEKELEIVSLSNDEVVFHITGDDELKIIEDAVSASESDCRIVPFRLERIPNGYNEPWYVKYFADSKEKRLMGIHVKYLMQVYNFIEGCDNDVKDFWWRERGRLCTLLEPERFGVSN